MSVTHPCPLSITSSLMLQHETHVTPTPQCHHNVTSCSLSSSLYTTPPTHHPRICVQPYAYAWLHPDHFTNIPTHMRYFQCICVANSSSTPFNPLPVHYSHAYAYNPTHKRGTHIQNSISHYPPTPRRASSINHSPKPLPNPMSLMHM
ncbi:hypothetical protein PIB30_107508, partial [Stylosanthes scabra]|nr:hypothetical protein [Stylosanthes scabra]